MILVLILCAATPTEARDVPIVTFRGYDGELTELRDGFYLDDSVNLWWIDGLVNHHTYYTPSPTYFHTRAIWMSPGVMTASAQYNGVDLSDVAGGVALMSPSDVGKTVFVRVPGGEWLTVRVGDTVQRIHMEFHIEIVDSGIELDYELAQRTGVLTHVNQYGGVGMYGFEVCTASSPAHCTGQPVDYETWFTSMVRYE